MSGITCADGVVADYNVFKLQNNTAGAKKRQFIIYRIKNEKVVIDEEGAAGASWTDFVNALTKDEKDSAYGLFDFKTEAKDGRILEKLVFVHWSSDKSTPIKVKMLYGSTRESFKAELGDGIAYTIQATDISDLDEAEVTATVQKGR